MRLRVLPHCKLHRYHLRGIYLCELAPQYNGNASREVAVNCPKTYHLLAGGGKVVEAAEVNPKDMLRIVNAQLRYYMHIPDPDSLSDEEWAARFRELEFIRREEAKANKVK